MRHYRFKKGANRLLNFEVKTLSLDPLLGVIEAETDHGFVAFAINSTLAAILLQELSDFIEHNGPMHEQVD